MMTMTDIGSQGVLFAGASNPTITLRSNQNEPIQKAIAYFSERKPKPSLIVLPTAWGKSILTAFVAQSMKDKLLVIQPSKELLEQNFKKYMTLCGEFYNNAGIYSASFGKKQVNQITYATIGSIKSLGAQFRQMGFTKMLIDEAHLYPREADSMLGNFLADSGITHVLGITATPIKLQSNTAMDGTRFSKLQMLTSRSKKGNFFKDILCVGQVNEMVNLKFWSKLQYSVRAFDESQLVFNSVKSEYTESSVQQSYTSNNIKQNITDELNSNADRKHILVFVPSVADAVDMAYKYNNSGVVYGEQDKAERESTINCFRSGKIRVLFNVRVLSTGFDFTGIDCIILGISTASIALYYQIIGRATRIDPDKKDALIIDFGGNVERFGHVEDIIYEKGDRGMWRMFGSDGKLLSGIPIHEIGSVTKDTIVAESNKQPDKITAIETMPFGKHKGEKLSDIPAAYRRWCLENFDWKPKDESLKQSLIMSMK